MWSFLLVICVTFENEKNRVLESGKKKKEKEAKMSENGTFRQGIGNDHQEKFEKNQTVYDQKI